MRVFISTGEVSGDIVGALLTERIRALEPSAEIVGVGGSRMSEAGVALDARTSHLGTVGVTEAVRAIPAFARVLAAIRRQVRAGKPDVAVLIGNDVFNVILARWLRRRGVVTVSYFPPQVWIWRAIAPFIARSYDAILTSFPLEHEVYGRAGERSGTEVSFVGHYLCDTLHPRSDAEIVSSRGRLGLGGTSRVLALLPGSRAHEIRRLAGPLLAAARELCRWDPGLRVVVPVSEGAYRRMIETEVDANGLAERVLVTGDSHEAMRSADAVVLASGTASLEAALLGVPMAIVYRVSAATRCVVGAVVRLGLIESETLGLPNLVLGRTVVPELRQSRATVGAVVREARSLLENALKRQTLRRELLKVAEELAVPGTVERVAEAVVGYARSGRGAASGGPSARAARSSAAAERS